jgi:CRP-like cAMP-binding protein
MYVDSKGVAHVAPDRLKQLWAFASTPLLSLGALAKRFKTRRLRMGDVLFRQGEPAAEMFLIVTGQLETVREEAPTEQSVQSADDDDDGGDDDGEAGDGEQRARERFQTGDELGLRFMLNASGRWEATAKVTSQSAVLLEMTRTELESAIDDDEGLRDGVGALKMDLERLQSAQRLQMLWPFAGADVEALECVTCRPPPLRRPNALTSRARPAVTCTGW